MKQLPILYAAILIGFSAWPRAAHAQSFELQQLILNVQKLEQLKSVLSKMKTGYDNLVTGYRMVNDVTKGNFDLHKAFLDKLLQVNPTVLNYYKVFQVLSKEASILSEYKDALNKFTEFKVFRPEELSYMYSVYKGLTSRSIRELDNLALVMTSGTLRMNDAERMNAIDGIDDRITEQLSFLRSFNSSRMVQAKQRFLLQSSNNSIRNFYGIKK